MRMTVLASGSKGNSTMVSSCSTRLLVDAGLSCRELMKRMRAAGEEPEALDAILITHEHLDHVNGLPVLARKLGIPVYFTEQTHRAWVRQVTPQKRMTYAQWLAGREQEMEARYGQGPDGEVATMTAAAAEGIADEAETETEAPKADPARLPTVEYFAAGRGFTVGDISVNPFTIPHDAADPCGFVFEAEGCRVAVATDLGYMPPNVKLAVKRCDVLMLESNHDPEMLRDGPYPWSVKQRVMSRVGHLSNHAAAEFLSKDYDGGAQFVILAHLSESNNLPELARMAAEEALNGKMGLLGNKVLLARQDAPMEPLCL
ncbi:MBL fold metallo-hydrolase [Terriglobus tenax]|uniref:MBL fold metallo-hydrolase n=1 Tax=Terriglobus tenax TaxID=1111115 RepID=UPI0021E008B4|nr:MBL fold metallo-hydrolase [Terriglobus tenax]